jgi:hypothetical protein
MSEGFLTAWLFLTIQLWVSLRWRNFTVGLTVGIVATLLILVLLARGNSQRLIAQNYPWALPIIAIARIAESTPARAAAAARGSLGGALLVGAMCWTLSRREWRG